MPKTLKFNTVASLLGYNSEVVPKSLSQDVMKCQCYCRLSITRIVQVVISVIAIKRREITWNEFLLLCSTLIKQSINQLCHKDYLRNSRVKSIDSFANFTSQVSLISQYILKIYNHMFMVSKCNILYYACKCLLVLMSVSFHCPQNWLILYMQQVLHELGDGRGNHHSQLKYIV